MKRHQLINERVKTLELHCGSGSGRIAYPLSKVCTNECPT